MHLRFYEIVTEFGSRQVLMWACGSKSGRSTLLK